MTTITQDINDLAGVDDNTSWTFYTEQIRLSSTGTAVVSTKKVRKYPVAGVLTVQLDPGPATVIAPDGKKYPFTVPVSDSDLWTLIAGAIGMPPGTTQQAIAAAVADYLNAHQIDEYHEYANFAAFPGTGLADRIYVALDTGKFYKWTGSAYQLISDTDVAAVTHAATSKTTPVDADELPIIDSAASNILKRLTFANLTAWIKSWIAKSDVGLSAADNTADTAKPVSTAQAAADAAVLSSATAADTTVLTTATGRAIAFAVALA